MGLWNVWLALWPMALAFSVNTALFAIILEETCRQEGWRRLSLIAFRETGKTRRMRIALTFCKVANIVAILVAIIPTVPSR